MLTISAVTLLLLGADEPRWELAAEPPGIRVYGRSKPGAEVREMKAMGLVDATPHEFWDVINDLENYKSTMPYVSESVVLKREDNSTLFYTRLNAPLVDPRDYIIKLVDDSKWDEGKGFLKVGWTVVNDRDELMPLKKEVVRVRINEGYWLLEPRDGGKKTFVTYYIYTSPGGSVPTFIANQGNSIAVPKVFEAIKKSVEARRAKRG